MGTFSIWHWLVVLIIVVLVFGTKKLRNMGGDLGSAIKGFKEGMKEGNTEAEHSETKPAGTSNTANLTFDEEVKQSSTTTNTFKESVQSQQAANATTAEPAAASKETITVEATPVTEETQKSEAPHVSSGPATTENTQAKN